MMNEYKHTQVGYLLIGLYSVVILFVGYLNITTGFSPIPLLVLLIMLIVLALFATLTVRVNDQMIRLQFGIGLIHKRFLLKDIETY